MQKDILVSFIFKWYVLLVNVSKLKVTPSKLGLSGINSLLLVPNLRNKRYNLLFDVMGYFYLEMQTLVQHNSVRVSVSSKYQTISKSEFI